MDEGPVNPSEPHEILALIYSAEPSGGRPDATAAEAVRQLLLRDPAVVHNRYGGSDQTPLYVAAESNLPEVAAVLLQFGADPNARNIDEMTPLQAICASQYTIIEDVVRLLLEHGARPHDPTSPIMQPIDLVVNRVSEYARPVVDLLCQHGASMTLWAAVNLSDLPAVQTILSSTPNPFQREFVKSNELLIRALDRCSLSHDTAAAAQIFRLLLDTGLDPNLRDFQGRTLLHQTALARSPYEVVERVLARTTDVNARDNSGKTALDLALADHDADPAVIDLLRRSGANERQPPS